MKIHFISIGGSIMHNMAIAMHLQGHLVSGSDDEIFEPAAGRLAKYGLLPENHGWYPEKITSDINMVILGMHAKSDNPELIAAQQKRLKIVSFPEFVYLNSQNKTRIVVAGSHGKTTITSMIMHVFRYCGKEFDYLVGSSVSGFEHSFKLTESADTIIIEGDEYLSSAINPEPKFLWYKPQLSVISGIAWDHANVFHTFEIYKKQFVDFLDSLPQNASVVYCSEDKELCKMIKLKENISFIPYTYPEYIVQDSVFHLIGNNGNYIPLKINGSHNLMNLEAARLICNKSDIDNNSFYDAIKEFNGAGKRLEKIYDDKKFIVFRDFAHAPSKVKATIIGICDQYKGKKIIACFELHTYSSLNTDFLPQYAHTMDEADLAIVFINEHAVKLKRMTKPEKKNILEAFQNKSIQVIYSTEELVNKIKSVVKDNTILLMMSSGNFGGINISEIC